MGILALLVLRARIDLLDKLRERQQRECLLDLGAGAACGKFIQRRRRKIAILPRVFLPLGRGERLKFFCRHRSHMPRHIFAPILLVTVFDLLPLSELFVVCARGFLV